MFKKLPKPTLMSHWCFDWHASDITGGHPENTTDSAKPLTVKNVILAHASIHLAGLYRVSGLMLPYPWIPAKNMPV